MKTEKVVFKDVTKTYGALTALDTLSMEIFEGEFISLLGPSGSGKSTTLNLLAGLLKADGGTIRIDGRVVNDLTPDKRNIAMVFQNYALYPHMSVRENLSFPLKARARKLPDSEIQQAIARIAPGLGLENLLDRYPKELSGGQQQRVALGRAMIRDPSVFLLDEPLSNLDVRLRIQMRRDIKAMHDRVGATTIYVTHDQSEALGLSDKIAVFNGGKLQQFAAPSIIYNNPVNKFVANFVGERGMNFVDGQLREEGGKAVFRAKGFEISLTSNLLVNADRSRMVTFGIRQEGVRPVSSGEAFDTSCKVEEIELSGPDKILILKIAEDHEITCRTDAMYPVSKGDIINVAFDRDRANLFDAGTEQALAL